MAGMYPDDRMVEIFGEQIMYPGLDKKTGKFTDGDFSDPLIKPSHIPAETFNLVLDNLSELVASLEKIPNNKDGDQLASALKNRFSIVEEYIGSEIRKAVADLKEFNHPIGDIYVQYPDSPSPKEKWPNQIWKCINWDAASYGLSEEMPVGNITLYSQGVNIPAGGMVLYRHPSECLNFYTAIEALTNAPEELDPVKFERYEPYRRIPRRFAQPWPEGLLEDNLEIGYQFSGGLYDGLYVTEISTIAGAFLSVAGGNRPTFESGGVQGDISRLLYGTIGSYYGFVPTKNGIIFPGYVEYKNNIGNSSSQGSGNYIVGSSIDSSLVVPTGPENSPRTLSVLHWRRVA